MMQSAQSTVQNDAQPASWLAVGSLAVGSFALVTSEFLPVGLLPQIANDIGISHGQAGLMATIPGVIAALAAPISIIMAGHIDRRRVLWMLLVLLMASNLIVATASGVYQLMAGRVLLGLAVGSFWTIAGSLGPRLRPGIEGIRASALILSGVSLGTVAGVPAGALIGEWFSWRVAFISAVLLSGLAMLVVLKLLPFLPAQTKSNRIQFQAIWKNYQARIGLMATAVLFVGQFAAYTYITPFLNTQAGISGNVLSAVLLANGIAGFIGNMIGGWLSSRNIMASVIATSSILGGAILLISGTGAGPAMSMLLVAIWGVGFGMMPIALQSWLFSTAPDYREDMQAIFVSVAQAAIGAGALLGGVTVDYAGLSAALFVGGAAALGTALISIVMVLKQIKAGVQSEICAGSA